MNHERVTKTMRDTSLRLVAALADDPHDPRVRQIAGVVADLAEYIDRTAAMKVTLERGGYDAPSFERQWDDAREYGPSLPEILIQLRSNVVDLDAERMKRRGLHKQTGA